MGWRTKAVIHGVLMALLILLAVFSVAIGKSSFDNVVLYYAPFILAVFVFLILWLAIGNLVSTAIERRNDHKEDE